MYWNKPPTSGGLGWEMTVRSLERLGREGRGGLCPAPVGFPGRGTPAEDMRMKGQEGPNEQGVRASEQVRLYQVSLQPCTKPPAAVKTATGPGLAARTATSGGRAPLHWCLSPASATLCRFLSPIFRQRVNLVTFTQYLPSWGLLSLPADPDVFFHKQQVRRGPRLLQDPSVPGISGMAIARSKFSIELRWTPVRELAWDAVSWWALGLWWAEQPNPPQLLTS